MVILPESSQMKYLQATFAILSMKNCCMETVQPFTVKFCLAPASFFTQLGRMDGAGVLADDGGTDGSKYGLADMEKN